MEKLSVVQQDALGNARYRLSGLSYLLENIIESHRICGDDGASSAFYSLQRMVDESIEDIDSALLVPKYDC